MAKGPGANTRCGWHKAGLKAGKVKRPPRRWGYPWTPEELNVLGDNYGLMSDKALARRLGRTKNGMVIAAKRKLAGLCRKQNFYTAHEVAQLLGCRCQKTVILWHSKGWLNGKQGPVGCGLNLMWQFTEQQVVAFLRERPWIADRSKLDGHYFASVIQEEWRRDRWYTTAELVKILGVGTESVRRYIRKGWLEAVRKPGGPHQGRWIVRQSSLDHFVVSDPRPVHRHQAMAESRRTMYLDAGRPVRVSMLWRLRCPSCGAMVDIISSPEMRGPAVRAKFTELCLNDTCHHAQVVNLSAAGGQEGGEHGGAETRANNL